MPRDPGPAGLNPRLSAGPRPLARRLSRRRAPVGDCPRSSIAKPPQTCRRIGIDPHPDLPACAGCGRCCHLVVELRPGDVVPETMVAEHAGVRCMDQHSNGACVALDPVTMLCTIYADRPQTCRDFNRGEDLCRKILVKYAGTHPSRS